MVLQVSQKVRRLSRDLRPSLLDHGGLLPSLSWLVNQLLKSESFNSSLEVTGGIRKLTPDVDVIIFRIVQEALNNIKRHARATEANVTINFEHQTIRLRISDNGLGFQIPPKLDDFTDSCKLGVISMRQRANFLNGSFNIDSELGKGTTISVKLVV
jgi:signal transduction histidine kinase